MDPTLNDPVLIVIAGTSVPRPFGPIRVGPISWTLPRLGPVQVSPLQIPAVRLSQISLPRAVYYNRVCSLASSPELAAIDKGGLFHIKKSYPVVRELIEHKRQKYPGRPVVVLGQSQGALLALKYAFDPEASAVAGVIPVVGPFEGSPWARLWHPSTAASCMAPGSRELQKILMEVRTRVAELGSAAPRIDLVGSDSDWLVKWHSALPQIDGANRHCFVTKDHPTMDPDIHRIPVKAGHLKSVLDNVAIDLYAKILSEIAGSAAKAA